MRVLESKIVEINPTTGKMLMWQKIAGTSDEVSDLPANVCTGSEFFEVDKGKSIYFEETASDWIDPTESDDTEPTDGGDTEPVESGDNDGE